jgi:hypothetical protein
MSAIEIDGVPADEEAFALATAPYGHFTAMQVRRGATRGLELHLRRLEAANREAFDGDLDREHVRALIRHALGDAADASVRVYVHEHYPWPTIVVTVKPPAGDRHAPTPLPHATRPDPHQARAHGAGPSPRGRTEPGFDDALLVGPDG